jgi:hypothetical protein
VTPARQALAELYSRIGWPERRLRALLLQVLYAIRDERMPESAIGASLR